MSKVTHSIGGKARCLGSKRKSPHFEEVVLVPGPALADLTEQLPPMSHSYIIGPFVNSFV